MNNAEVSAENNVKLITAKQLAKLLSISPRTVWRLRSAGKLPMPVTFGGSVRWRLSDIALWQELRCPNEKTFETIKNTESKRR